MTPAEFRAARLTLGDMWGKARPLFASEMAIALRLTGGHATTVILDMERGKRPISGPISALIELYLAGVPPPDGIPQGGHRPD